MSLPVSKNISASAGTGKTYRLSLEYLALLLKYYENPEFKPDQILVITFTRKATAEIRDRIYAHLQTIVDKNESWQSAAINLKRLSDVNEPIDEDNPLSDSELKILGKAYRYLTAHKDQLQVMTIDSYIHSIFRNLIRPVRGIDRFELDLKAVDKRMPFLLNELMTPLIRKRIEPLISRKLKPALDEYQAFFRSLIDNRWIFYLTRVRKVITSQDSLADYANHPELWGNKAAQFHNDFLNVFTRIIDEFCAYLMSRHNIMFINELIEAKLFNKDYMQLFSPLPHSLQEMKTELSIKLQDDGFLQKLLRLLSDGKYLWNGTKVRASKTFNDVETWKSWHQQASKLLSDYFVFRFFLPEQAEILEVWNDVLLHYDRLIYRYKTFTYDDIAWFTFEALYSSFPPLFKAEDEEVANEFYDFMSRRTRFMLIDEFQDTSILQFNILRPMIEELLSGEGTKPYGGYIIVGDEKQSIFGWRGGQRDLLLNMEKIFPSIHKTSRIALTDSWRSSPVLMDFINGVFQNPRLHDFLLANNSVWKYPAISGKKTELDSDTVVKFKLVNYNNRVHNENLTFVMRDFVENVVIPALPAKGSKQRSIAVLARKNDELELIRSILAEHGISGEFQSSKSLLEHPVIKAIMFMLRFRIYNDWYDFLAFLRSDIILMNGKDLKAVIGIVSEFRLCTDENKVIDFSSYPVADAAYNLSSRLNSNLIRTSCLQILQACQIPQKLTLDRDFVNIQRFLDLAWQYESTYQAELPCMQGFLRYCSENYMQEAFQQQDVESTSAIQLLTIHKSKGLEFDSVFVWWNLKSYSGQDDSRLKSYVNYSDAGFNNLCDYALTLHYKKTLACSSYGGIMESDEQRMQLEELNNLYVALTRAKSRLYIYTVFTKKGGWAEYIENLDKTAKLAPRHYAIMAIMQYMQENAISTEDNTWHIGNPDIDQTPPDAILQDVEQDLHSAQTSPDWEETITEKLKLMIPDWRHPWLNARESDDIEINIDWKHSFLERRENLFGELAHYFLARLKYAEATELEAARIFTRRQFGNLIPLEEIDRLLQKLEILLPSMSDIFHPDYDLVYTEYPIYKNGKEFRIDRLMINTKKHTYRLIDFKTGGIYQKHQLEFYASLVKELLPGYFEPACVPEYITIDLD